MTRSVARRWSNWAGNQHADPRQVIWPADAGEVAHLVTQAAESGTPVKVVGTGHSFTPIAVTEGVQVRLERMSGLTAVDHETGLVSVLAGTTLRDLNLLLDGHGLALANLGDIDSQTLAGAMATGTHGTGARLGGLASQVAALKMITADGSQTTCSVEDRPDLFNAARVGLGALGIITEITLQCVPAFALRAVERPEPLDQVLTELDQSVADHDHFEFYWFPYTDRTATKRNDRLPAGEPVQPLPQWRYHLDDEVMANRAYEGINRLGHARPSLIPSLNNLSARALTARTFSDASYRVFVTPRRVRFIESEYAVPPSSVVPVLTELRRWLNDHDRVVSFPIEVRFAAADDVWLSTGYQRDNGYIAVHQYHRGDARAYFAAFESIVAEHQGRPHWGKLHTLTAERLGALYPRFDDFRAVRDRHDPGRVFSNDHLAHILGP